MRSTGWYGIPGGPEVRSSKVHVVNDNGPICGSKISDKQQFQRCANGVVLPYVECEHCRKKLIKELKKKNEH